jgi:hypothetical protein
LLNRGSDEHRFVARQGPAEMHLDGDFGRFASIHGADYGGQRPGAVAPEDAVPGGPNARVVAAWIASTDGRQHVT